MSLQAWDLGIIAGGEFHKTGRTHSRRALLAYLRNDEEGNRAAWERWDDGNAGSEPFRATFYAGGGWGAVPVGVGR